MLHAHLAVYMELGINRRTIGSGIGAERQQ